MASISILPSIATLPLPDDQTKELFSRAVCLVKANSTKFESVGAWLDKYYSETAMRKQYEQAYRRNFAYRLRLLRHDSPTYRRRLAIQQGRPLDELKLERINEALFRGQRWKNNRLVTRGQPTPEQLDSPAVKHFKNIGTKFAILYPDEHPIDQSNVHLVWQQEDERYRERFREIKAERRSAKLDEHDRPDDPCWRLAKAVAEITEAEYADPPEHIEHSRRIVGIAALLVCADMLPMLGEFGRWEWARKPDTTWDANPNNSSDDILREISQPPAQDGPHRIPLHMLHARHKGREEVLFCRMPGEPRSLEHQWSDVSAFRDILRVAVEELERLDTSARANSRYKSIFSWAKTFGNNPVGSKITFSLLVRAAKYIFSILSI